MEKIEKKRAAALKYNPDTDNVPVMTVFGEGYLAEKIISMARESGVPVVPDPGLTSMLAKMSVGDEIPEELYEVVAKVLIFVGEMDRKYGARISGAAGRR